MAQMSIPVLVRELLSWRAVLDIFLIAAGWNHRKNRLKSPRAGRWPNFMLMPTIWRMVGSDHDPAGQ